MGTRRKFGRGRRGRRPTLERVESRELLSVAPMLYHAQAVHARQVQAEAAGGGGANSGSTDQTGLPGFQTDAAPTPHEAARIAFHAGFKGSYTVGPGRFTNQANLVYFRGAGSSNQFLHAYFSTAYITFKDHNTPITGTANIPLKNVTSSGNLLVLDLTFNPDSLVGGLPTQFSWTVDPSSAGTYSGATGQGTGKVIYQPGTRLPSRATGAGNFGFIFDGSIYTSGVSNVLVF